MTQFTADGLRDTTSKGFVNGYYTSAPTYVPPTVLTVLSNVAVGSHYMILRQDNGKTLSQGLAGNSVVISSPIEYYGDFQVIVRIRLIRYLPYEGIGTVTNKGLAIFVVQELDTLYGI